MFRHCFQTEISRLQRKLQRLPMQINEGIRALRQILEVLEEELAIEAPPPRYQHQTSKLTPPPSSYQNPEPEHECVCCIPPPLPQVKVLMLSYAIVVCIPVMPFNNRRESFHQPHQRGSRNPVHQSSYRYTTWQR